eukprot:CAMPEP_0206577530 /NCGR_PEP_ID=MMETSP0325_2-20121206/31414_1 /ASSEMBLY_ACC=CAM_ASM_000347 /TAXON_ID=2866 /ORGANISM="Crypthecodinium cohnii, Strain Seligo" /LENGTH=57 /DNA_ID=CAMNT_0054082979 /DNA_START=174 /DNA_END=344 /DNA_ORIENTATION=-
MGGAVGRHSSLTALVPQPCKSIGFTSREVREARARAGSGKSAILEMHDRSKQSRASD